MAGGAGKPVPYFGAHFAVFLTPPGSVRRAALGGPGRVRAGSGCVCADGLRDLGRRRRILFVSSPYVGTYFASLPCRLPASVSPSLPRERFAKAKENTLLFFSVKSDRMCINRWHAVNEVVGTE